jgi:hypothetical protein
MQAEAYATGLLPIIFERIFLMFRRFQALVGDDALGGGWPCKFTGAPPRFFSCGEFLRLAFAFCQGAVTGAILACNLGADFSCSFNCDGQRPWLWQ